MAQAQEYSEYSFEVRKTLQKLDEKIAQTNSDNLKQWRDKILSLPFDKQRQDVCEQAEMVMMFVQPLPTTESS